MDLWSDTKSLIYQYGQAHFWVLHKSNVFTQVLMNYKQKTNFIEYPEYMSVVNITNYLSCLKDIYLQSKKNWILVLGSVTPT